jgi:hypothetical protein
MTFEEVIAVLQAKPYWFSSMHDYTLGDGEILALGIFEDVLEHLRTKLSDDWVFVERRRNTDNDFLRIDIVKQS